MDAIRNNPHFGDASNDHGDTIVNVARVIRKYGQSADHLEIAVWWLNRWDDRYRREVFFDVMRAVFDILATGHRPENRKRFGPVFGEHRELMNTLLDRALERDLLGTDWQFIATRSTLEIGRYSIYPDTSNYVQVREVVRTIRTAYEDDSAFRPIWLRVVAELDYNDPRNCEHYETCDWYAGDGFNANFRSEVFGQELECPTNYCLNDRVTVHAQNLDGNQLAYACGRLSEVSSTFHRLFDTNCEPVASDFSNHLNAYVFHDISSCEDYSSAAFFTNADTCSGIYYERDPADRNTTPYFVASEYESWESPPDPRLSIWNWEHEYVHYLDGRYNRYDGYKGDLDSLHWWTEGIPNYLAAEVYRHLNQPSFETPYTLAEILLHSDSLRIGYRHRQLAVRYFMENHRDFVDTILGHMRRGEYDAYHAFLEREVGRYSDAWKAWLRTGSAPATPTPPPPPMPPVVDGAPMVSFADAVVSAPEGGTVRLTIGIGESRDTPTTIGYVHVADDDPATSDADDDDHNGIDGAVPIAAGETEATFEIAIHDDSDIEPARETFIVALDPSTFSEFRPGVTRTAVVIEEGVCDRTPAVRDHLRESRHCSAVSDTDLAEIYGLNLNGRLDGLLQAGDLSGLTGMGDMRLQDNHLAALPAAVFGGLSNLRYLFLNRNELSALPGSLFDHTKRLDWLYLHENNIAALPDGIFEGLANLTQLQLRDNPGAPFTLTLDWLRTDATDPATPGPATIVASVREGTPFDMEVGISATNGRLSAEVVQVPAGATRSAPVSVEPIGAGSTRVTFDASPTVPGTKCGNDGFPCFDGIITAAGKALVLFGIPRLPVEPPAAMRGADVVRIELLDLFPDAPGEDPTYTAESSDPALASAAIRDGVLTLVAGEPGREGAVAITVTRTGGDGSTTTRTFSVTVRPRAASEAMVHLFPSTFDTVRQGFVRVINRSAEEGEVDIAAFEDSGRSRPPVSLAIGPGETNTSTPRISNKATPGKASPMASAPPRATGCSGSAAISTSRCCPTCAPETAF